MSTVAVGDAAPDFTLPGVAADGTRRDFALSEFEGQPVVLAFYPGDNTAVCTKQLCSYRDNFSEFEGLDAVVLGLSPQSVLSHDEFRAKHGFPFPLLADESKDVAKAYGAIGPLGYKRSVFVIDRGGIIRWKHVAALVGVTYKNTKTIADVLKTL
jgi:peroxiredoxin Q/BCP